MECNSLEICDELENLKIETEQLNIDIIGISQLNGQWKETKKLYLTKM